MMAGPIKTVEELADFMSASKAIAAPQSQGDWRQAHNPNELIMKWPLEINGEIQPLTHLGVVGRTDTRELFFRIMILCPFAVSRLDWTQETHPNSVSGVRNGLPPLVSGPHYHSWPLNERFLKDLKHPSRLLDAAEFNGGGRSFDAILRWFCEDNNIEPLPPAHRLELPSRETLFG